MTEETSNKQFPQATPELTHLFGLHDTEDHVHASAEPVHSQHGESITAPGNLPVANLPVVHIEAEHVDHPSHHGSEQVKVPALHGLEKEAADPMHAASEEPVKTFALLPLIKTVVPYFAIFAIAIFLYAFFFSSVDFSSWFKFKTSVPNPKETALMALEKQNLAGYQTWVSQYYYDISDSKVIDPNVDNSGNGLTNFQKYILNLNPKSYDSLGLGMSDSDALSRGINPVTGTPLNDAQKKVLDTYFDLETIANKEAVAKIQKAGSSTFGVQTASASTARTDFGTSPAASSGSQFGSATSFENGSNTTAAAAAASANPVGGAPDPIFGNLDIDTNIPGRLEVPQLSINAPIMWSSSPDSFDKDLQSGVIHYPGTALPGQVGTAYISGHSSNYVWAKGNFNHVFTHLNDLKDNDSFKVTVVLKNGKNAILHYVVTSRQQYQPDDIAQFQNGGKSVMALSTCWPVGSTAKRLVLFADLTQVEQ